MPNYSIGLVGKKCGMTRIFTEDGIGVPATVIEILPNHISQVKTQENDGYRALQITYGKKKASRVNKPRAGHFAKADLEAGETLYEFRLSEQAFQAYKDAQLGQEIPLDVFEEGQVVDVSGITKGKGFQGTVKRHHFRMQDATHGNSLSHRAPGSIGQRQTPGRVFKGKKMSGHMGNVKRTVRNQKIVKIDKTRNLILIRGAAPGAPGGRVVILPTKKSERGEG